MSPFTRISSLAFLPAFLAFWTFPFAALFLSLAFWMLRYLFESSSCVCLWGQSRIRCRCIQQYRMRFLDTVGAFVPVFDQLILSKIEIRFWSVIQFLHDPRKLIKFTLFGTEQLPPWISPVLRQCNLMNKASWTWMSEIPCGKLHFVLPSHEEDRSACQNLRLVSHTCCCQVTASKMKRMEVLRVGG